MDLKKVMILAAGAAALAAWLAWESPAGGPGGSRHAESRPPGGQPQTAAREPRKEAPRTAVEAEARRRDCDIGRRYLANGDGTASEVLSCEPREPRPGHPYENYPTESLASLAYADPNAAAVLSLRWRESDTEAAMSMALRAAALSGGDATPIVAFANAYPGPTAIDDVPVRRTVHAKYVLGTVTKLLGDERHATPYFEALIRQYSQEPEREIALLQRRARQLLEEMRHIQLDVTGASTIGG